MIDLTTLNCFGWHNCYAVGHVIMGMELRSEGASLQLGQAFIAKHTNRHYRGLR
jgi:hypothetical protein